MIFVVSGCLLGQVDLSDRGCVCDENNFPYRRRPGKQARQPPRRLHPGRRKGSITPHAIRNGLDHIALFEAYNMLSTPVY